MQTAVLNQVTVQAARREAAATCRTAPTLFRASVRMDLLIAASGVMNVTPRQSRGQRRTRMVTFPILQLRVEQVPNAPRQKDTKSLAAFSTVAPASLYQRNATGHATMLLTQFLSLSLR